MSNSIEEKLKNIQFEINLYEDKVDLYSTYSNTKLVEEYQEKINKLEEEKQKLIKEHS